MNYWLGCIGTWLLSDGIYSWVLYSKAQSWQGNKQTFLKDHWIRCLRIILGFILIGLGAIN